MATTGRARIAGILLAWVIPWVGAGARAQGIAGIEDSMREAQDQPVEITADRLEYEAERKLYVASGNVEVRQGPRSLRADWMAFNPETGIGVASGDVALADSGDVLEADFVHFHMDTLRGVIRNGRLDSPSSQFKAEGREIEKIGERTYRFEGGIFTTCRCPDEECTEPWRIQAESAELEVDGYGTVRDARFEVLDVPVVWLPWMIYPLKTERETGLLFPEISIGSRDGFGLGVPFFWAARENLNWTITPGFTTERGFNGDTELEYVVGEESWGDAYGAYLYDLKIDPYSDDEPYGRNRWGTTGRQDWHLPGELRFKADWTAASDNDAPLDIDGLSGQRADHYLQSVASLSRQVGASGRFGGFVAAWFAEDLQGPDDLDRDDTLLQRVPQLGLAALPGGIPFVPWLMPSLDLDYTLYKAIDRANGDGAAFLDTGVDGVFDPKERGFDPIEDPDPHRDDFADTGGTEGDGRFQEGEPLTDDGQRLIVAPRVAAPFRVGDWLEAYPEAGWQQTLYSTREDGSASRGLFTGRVDLRSRLRRRYDSGLVHLIEPRLGYAYVSRESQSGNPLLVPATALPQDRIRVLDLDTVTRDTADRIPRANRLSFGVSQRAWAEAAGGADGADARLRADLTVLGIYEFARGEFGQVVADARLAPRGLGQVRASAGFRPEDAVLEEVLAEWGYTHDAGHRFSLGYRYLRHVPDFFEDYGTGRFDHVRDADRVNQGDAGFLLRLTRRWTLAYRIAYSFEIDRLLGNEGRVEYTSECGCWGAGVEISQDRARGVDVKFLYRLIGLGLDEQDARPGLLDAPEGV